jgi:HTH-type transcriptional regulator / antitoxin HipB
MDYIASMNYPILTTAQLSSHLSSLRKARNLTQTQLGTRVGLNQSRIGKIERDPAHVSVGTLLKILAVLDVRVMLLASPKKGAGATVKSVDGANDW